MRRWIIKITTALSLALCIAICALWIRSYYRSDAVRYRKAIDHEEPMHARVSVLYSGAGAVQFGVGTSLHYMPRETSPPYWWSYSCEDDPEQPSQTPITTGWKHSIAGFGLLSDRKSGPPMSNLPLVGHLFVPTGFQWTRDFAAVWVPHWSLALLFAMLPARRMQLWLRSRRRKARGLCLSCGYDLRGGSQQCPECGSTIPTNTVQTLVPQP